MTGRVAVGGRGGVEAGRSGKHIQRESRKWGRRVCRWEGLVHYGRYGVGGWSSMLGSKRRMGKVMGVPFSWS